MKRTVITTMLTAVLTLAALPAVAAEPQIPTEWQAMTEMQTSQGVNRGMQYHKDGKMRTDVGEWIFILRPDLNQIFMLNPKDQTAMVMDSDSQQAEEQTDINDYYTDRYEMKKKRLGTETIGGVLTTHYMVSVTDKQTGEVEEMETWEAKRDRGLPRQVKMRNDDGEEVIIRYSEIEFDVADSVFEIPDGYRRTTVAGEVGSAAASGCFASIINAILPPW